jgi:hypothetical protein
LTQVQKNFILMGGADWVLPINCNHVESFENLQDSWNMYFAGRITSFCSLISR